MAELNSRAYDASAYTRRATLHSASTIQRCAEALREESERLLRSCAQGTIDREILTEALAAIDRHAAIVRHEVGRCAGWDSLR